MVPLQTRAPRCFELAQANAANPFPPNPQTPYTLAHQAESAKGPAISDVNLGVMGG